MDWASHMRRIVAHPLVGDDATFTHGTGQPASVKGRFFSPYVEVLPGLAGGIDASKPHFAAMTSDLPSVAQGDVVALTSGTYNVVNIQPDDPSGITVLELEKQ